MLKSIESEIYRRIYTDIDFKATRIRRCECVCLCVHMCGGGKRRGEGTPIIGHQYRCMWL